MRFIEARKLGGAFRDLFDFCQRIDLRKINKRSFEALIKSGAMDCFGKHRAALLASLQNALQLAEQSLHNETSGQHDLLSMHAEVSKPEYVEATPWNEALRLQGEKETLGFYLTGHPLNRYMNELANFTTCKIADLHPSEHKNACTAGIITNVRTRQTKRGDRMAIFTLDDGSTQVEVVCFSEAFQKFRSLLVEDQLIVIDGEISMDDFNNNTRIMAREIYSLDQARARFAKSLEISIDSSKFDLYGLQRLLSQHVGGCCPVILKYKQDDMLANIRLGQQWLVKPTEMLLGMIRDQLQVESIEFQY